MQTDIRNTFIRNALCGVVGIAVGACAAGTALAETAKEFYSGKTVRIVVGYGPGGGYDAYARMLAPHLAKQIGATVIVENTPGGGGLNALSALLREPGDGLRIQILNAESASLAQAIGRGKNRFDLRKLAFLGRVSYENRTLVGRKDTAYRNINAYLNAKKPIIFGTGSRTDSLGAPASLFCYSFQLPCKLITGYKGANDVALAVERGELDSMVTSESQSDKLAKGSPVMLPIAILSPNKAALLKGVPSIFELTNVNPEQAKWMNFNAQMAELGRSLIVPGDTPADRIAFLTKAVDSVLTDAAVVAEADRTKRPINYATGAKTKQTLQAFFTTLDPATTKKLKNILMNAY